MGKYNNLKGSDFKNIILIDPKIQDVDNLGLILIKSYRGDNSVICSLCSSFQSDFFSNKNCHLFDIGDSLFQFDVREKIRIEIGDSEQFLYNVEKKAFSNFPYTPLKIRGATNSILSRFLPQLIIAVKHIKECKIETITVHGSKEFYDTIKAILAFYDYNARLICHRLIKEESNVILNKIKTTLIVFARNLKCIVQSLFTRKPLVIFTNTKSTKFFLNNFFHQGFVSVPEYTANYFGNKWFFSSMHKLLERNDEVTIAELNDYFSNELLKESLMFFYTVFTKKIYTTIVSTIVLFTALKFFKKNIIYITDSNQTYSNLFTDLFNDKKTIFVQHAILPGSYRLVINQVHAMTAIYYSRFNEGPLKPVIVNAERVKYIPYFYSLKKTENESIVLTKEWKVLFAPTSEGYLFSDWEYNFITKTCESLSNKFSSENFDLIVKLHPLTPYLDFIYSKISDLKGVRTSRVHSLEQLLPSVNILIASVNSNTIIEGFISKKAVVVLNVIGRQNYLKFYEPGICEVFTYDELIERIDALNSNREEYEKLISIQNSFVEKYIKIN